MINSDLTLIKTLAIKAMVSDDYLFDKLVLKGGNAMDIIYKLSGRASLDLDYSIEDDFPQKEIKTIENKIQKSLIGIFSENNFVAFDIKLYNRPKHREVSPDLKDFWGGYRIEFKVISKNKYEELKGDTTLIRKYSEEFDTMHGKKFFIDISKYEFTQKREEKNLDGYSIYVYSPEMLVIEKIRAICQQMPEYGKIVRSTSQSARARDFFDVHLIITTLDLDVISKDNVELFKIIFEAKRVPLKLLSKIKKYRDFHEKDFFNIKDTVPPNTKLKKFNFYFDYVCNLVEKIKIP